MSQPQHPVVGMWVRGPGEWGSSDRSTGKGVPSVRVIKEQLMSQENEPRGRNNPRKQQPALDTAPHQVFFWGLLQDLLKAAQGCAPTCPAYGAAGVVLGGKVLTGMASFAPLSPSVHHFGTCPCSAAAGSWQALCQGPLSNPLLNLSGSDPYLCAPAVTKLQQLGDVPGRTRPDFTAAKTSPCFRSR